jgi:hypothetical protein
MYKIDIYIHSRVQTILFIKYDFQSISSFQIFWQIVPFFL